MSTRHFELTDEQLLEIWKCFWDSQDIEPVYMNVPKGVSNSEWVSMVYYEAKRRGLPIEP
jgi:hypothetical protein